MLGDPGHLVNQRDTFTCDGYVILRRVFHSGGMFSPHQWTGRKRNCDCRSWERKRRRSGSQEAERSSWASVGARQTGQKATPQRVEGIHKRSNCSISPSLHLFLSGYTLCSICCKNNLWCLLPGWKGTAESWGSGTKTSPRVRKGKETWRRKKETGEHQTQQGAPLNGVEPVVFLFCVCFAGEFLIFRPECESCCNFDATDPCSCFSWRWSGKLKISEDRKKKKSVSKKWKSCSEQKLRRKKSDEFPNLKFQGFVKGFVAHEVLLRLLLLIFAKSKLLLPKTDEKRKMWRLLHQLTPTPTRKKRCEIVTLCISGLRIGPAKALRTNRKARTREGTTETTC